jgi:exodeoxyribonuclease VII small subunit
MSSQDYMGYYDALKNSAQQLAEMQEPDVDRIMPLVTQGMEAYKHCKARIDAVRQQLLALDD